MSNCLFLPLDLWLINKNIVYIKTVSMLVWKTPTALSVVFCPSEMFFPLVLCFISVWIYDFNKRTAIDWVILVSHWVTQRSPPTEMSIMAMLSLQTRDIGWISSLGSWMMMSGRRYLLILGTQKWEGHETTWKPDTLMAGDTVRTDDRGCSNVYNQWHSKIHMTGNTPGMQRWCSKDHDQRSS